MALANTCRACLGVRDQHQPIPSDIYSDCTSIKITESDGLPTIICPDCYNLLNRLYYFKQQCLRSDTVLRHHVKTLSEQLQYSKLDKNEAIISRNDTNTIATIDEHNGNSFNGEQVTLISEKENDQFDDIMKTNINSEDGKLQSEDSPKKLKKSNKRSTKMLHCQKCDKSFYKYVKLEAHMRKHFGMKPDSTISCNQCNKKFSTEKNLKSHQRVHTGERKYQCKTCGKAFAYLNVLKNHERAHAGIKKYGCHLCGKKFVQQTNLNTHLSQHSGEKPYICEPCDRRFGQPSEYKLHMLRHTGVKNFACNLCPLRFYTNANLRKHMGVHSDVRPYACKSCDKRFKTRSYMAVHNRTHTGERPFSCEYCLMKFMSGKDRRNHLKIHTGEKTSPRTKKPKNKQNPKSNSELLQTNDKELMIPEQNLRDPVLSQIVPPISNTEQYHTHTNLHSLSSPCKVITKTEFLYESLNPLPVKDTPPPNFYQLQPICKAECSYNNPTY